MKNQEISFGWYSGDAKLSVTTGNLGGGFAPENRNGFIDSSIETAAKKPRRRFDTKKTKKRERDAGGEDGYKAKTGAKDDRRDLPT